jgi:F0F1-type ATP synthase assembly protein I
LATLGFEMVAPIGLGVFLDLKYDTRPWCSLVGVLLGFFGGMAHLILTLNAVNKKLDRNDRGRT